MTAWSRNDESVGEDLTFRVKLAPHQWTTVNPGGEKAGYDLGGDLHLVKDIFASVKSNEIFKAFTIDRRATRTMFVPRIIVKDEALPPEMTSPEGIGALALGPSYDIFVSFGSKEEASLFKLSNSGGVGIGFRGD